MTALIKKPTGSDRKVVEISDSLASCVRRLTVIDRARNAGSMIDLLMERISTGSATSMVMTITTTEELDGLIEALVELRETYR